MSDNEKKLDQDFQKNIDYLRRVEVERRLK